MNTQKPPTPAKREPARPAAKRKSADSSPKTVARKPRQPKKGTNKGPSKRQAKKILEEGAKTVKEEDIKKVRDKSEEIKSHFTKGPLGQYIDEAKLLLGLVGDYWSGDYRKIPYWSLAAIVFTLLYVLNPFDLIPDFIPVIGQLDDLAVFGVCLLLVTQDLEEYKSWKTSKLKKNTA